MSVCDNEMLAAYGYCLTKIFQGFLTTLAEHKATYLNLVPPIVLFLANSDKATSRHLENVRTIMSGAAPLGASDIERFQKK